MQNKGQKITYTTVSIDKETGNLVEKICKRYSLKKSEVVKLAFRYIDKANINSAESPESVKSELSKINKRQDDIIRFIRNYEEKELNPMIRATNSIAVRFDSVAKTLETLIISLLEKNLNTYNTVLQRISDQIKQHADVINNQGKQIGSLQQTQKKDNAKLLKLISLYADLAACGVMDGKRKENLKAIGNTEQEQAEAMKRYIREVSIPEYAKNFNKRLSAEDIKFYGKIHFNRDRSDNRLNMHCHLIVSHKDQSNKVKISPLTNHRNTKKDVITGGFDRTTLFQEAEKGFDELFGYNWQLSETFEY